MKVEGTREGGLGSGSKLKLLTSLTRTTLRRNGNHGD
jgi:hypothetical protein